ncbi:MAG: DNA-binding protein Alba [Thermoprotei archaeon]|nr:MAG: DNA-binding protein Alba [Thermoprotei archaeon]
MSEASKWSVFVGGKPTMNYVLACLTLFHQGANEVVLKARGRAINKAVDAALLVLNRFMADAKVKRVEVGTERLTTDDGRPVEKSVISITLSRGP